MQTGQERARGRRGVDFIAPAVGAEVEADSGAARAGGGLLPDEQCAARAQRPRDPREDPLGAVRFRPSAEDGDEIEARVGLERGDVTDLEAGIREAEVAGPSAPRVDGGLRAVVADEATRGKRLREPTQRAAAAAVGVEHVDPAGETRAPAGHARRRQPVEHRDDTPIARLREHAVEGLGGGGREPAAGGEALDDLVLERPEQRDPATRLREIAVPRGPGQRGRMPGRKPIGLHPSVVVDDPTADHRVEPRADTTLGEPGPARDDLALRGRQAREHVEEPGAVPDREQQCESAAVEGREDPLGEGLGMALLGRRRGDLHQALASRAEDSRAAGCRRNGRNFGVRSRQRAYSGPSSASRSRSSKTIATRM